MATLFCVRPATRNIGNDLINRATADLLYAIAGDETAIVTIPALRGAQFGGLTAAQVYDMNRLADGVVIGGGNLFENGQLTVDLTALDALQVPLMMIGIAHGRIYDDRGRLIDRTDAMPPQTIRRLCAASSVTLVRDRATLRALDALGTAGVELGGCPSLFMEPNPEGRREDGRVLLSIRHPGRMSVPPAVQWRVAEDVRRLIAALHGAYGNVHLVCHDYRDLEFARGFPGTPCLYFDDVERYIAALRACRLSVSYRLHAFLPCVSFGTPSVHISYDERGRDMIATAGMGAWDIDLMNERDVVGAVMDRVANIERFQALRAEARTRVEAMRKTTNEAIRRFAAVVKQAEAQPIRESPAL